MTTDFVQHLRHCQAAWRGLDRIVGITAIASPDVCWWQAEYRSRCGTGCCYAGQVALAVGGFWLVDIRDRQLLIDGTSVTEDDCRSVPYSIWQYMRAMADDPWHLVREVRGKPVIHVSHRAAHLIGLEPEAEHHDDGRLRLRLLAVAGRLVHGGRRLHLRIPARWPWARQIIYRPGPPARPAGTNLTTTRPPPTTRKGNPAGPWNPADPARQPGSHADHSGLIDLQPKTSADQLKVEKERG